MKCSDNIFQIKLDTGRIPFDKCMDFVPQQTNADKIRNMTNEELANFLEEIVSGNRDIIGINCGNSKCESWKCTECISTWLQSQD